MVKSKFAKKNLGALVSIFALLRDHSSNAHTPPPPSSPSQQPLLARAPREVSDAGHDGVPARLHLAWRVKRNKFSGLGGALERLHGTAAGPNTAVALLRSRDAALRQRDKGASSRLCRCQDGAFDLAALPRKSNSMLHASEATATYW